VIEASERTTVEEENIVGAAARESDGSEWREVKVSSHGLKGVIAASSQRRLAMRRRRAACRGTARIRT
jgi:hypothetical protein